MFSARAATTVSKVCCSSTMQQQQQKLAVRRLPVMFRTAFANHHLQQQQQQQQHCGFATKSERPFRILGVQQIAIGCEDRASLNSLWQDVFGLSSSLSSAGAAPHYHRIETENVEEDILQVGPAPYAVEIDLMTPIDPEASPKVHKPPLNHIGLWVDSLERAVQWMDGQGVRFTPGGIRKGAAGHLVAFIHPKGNEAKPIGGNGVLIELVQAPEHVIQAFTTTSSK